MELDLAGVTALVLGVGDGLDFAVVRELSEAGAGTLAIVRDLSDMGLAAPDSASPHWTSVEDGIDEVVVGRLVSFLREQGRAPNIVVAQIDLDDAVRRPRRSPLTWLSRRAAFTRVMDELLAGVLASIPESGRSSIVLVFRLRATLPEAEAYRWLESAMVEVVRRARERGLPGIRVNSLLVGEGDVYSEAAHAIAFLASPLADRISGAYLPVDDGQTLARA